MFYDALCWQDFWRLTRITKKKQTHDWLLLSALREQQTHFCIPYKEGMVESYLSEHLLHIDTELEPWYL